MRAEEASQLASPLAEHFAALPAAWRGLPAAPSGRIAAFVDARRAAGARIYPAQPLAALHGGGPGAVRVLILGQDPYHGPGQAHGFAFSVRDGVRPPPSLRNIFRELARDGFPGCADSRGGCLLHWSHQGVLLLNTVLTVESGSPGSHAGQGWEDVTDAVIERVAQAPGPRVFLLWGAHAQAKRARIAAAAAGLPEAMQPLVLLANHPSPLAARRPPLPFIGCGHFSQTNRYLVERGLAPIDW
jgi:uracil-DNA glycosylase